MNETKLTLIDVEHQLSEQGQFCLLDWLIAHNILPYSHYENWRHGNSETLIDEQTKLAEPMQSWITAADKHCAQLQLQSEPQQYFSWGSTQTALITSSNKTVHKALSQVWMRQQDIPQLDLFMDNAATIAENQLRQSLSGRQFDTAQEQLQRLTQLNAKHAKLGGYQDLINYGQHLNANPTVLEEALLPELNGLEQEVVPLAQEILGSSSRDYLALAWRRLGDNSLRTALNSEKPELHASYAYARVPDWQAVEQSLRECQQLYQSPLLLQRFAQALENQQQHAQALYIWCLLFDVDADYGSKVAESGQYRQIADLWDQFWDISEAIIDTGEDQWTAFFPCFVLFRHAGLIHLTDQFMAFNNAALCAAFELIGARQRGDNEVSYREQLHAIHPALVQLYIRSQKTT